MSKIKPLITSEYYQFAQSLNIDTPFQCPIDNAGKTVEIKPARYTVTTDQEEKVDVVEPQPHPRISTLRYQGKNGSFLRITNVADFIPKTDAALIVSATEYRAAQLLGITKNIDQTLTAKVIGLLGDYRFRVLKDQEQYQLRTTLFHEKNSICNNAFMRLHALQKIERAFGRSFEETFAAIENYKKMLKKIYAENERGQSAQNISDSQRKIYFRNRISITEHCNNLKGLQEELKGLQTENPNATYHAQYGLDTTKFPIERFVRETTNKIIDAAKLENELITIANGNSAFRGVFEESLGKAEKLCTNFTFHQDHLIEPEHQGNYSKQKKVTILSSQAVGDGREELRKFLLASSYILNCDNKNDPMHEPDGNFTVSNTRGWTRLFRKEKTDRKVFQTYNQLRHLAAKANISRLKTAVEDISDIKDLLKQVLSKAARGILSAFGREFYKVGADFIIEEKIDEEKTPLTNTEFRLVIDENWHRWPEQKKINYIIDTLVKELNSKQIELTESQKQFIDMMRKETNAAPSAPLALPPTQLGHTDPDDFLSSIVGGLETFYNVFDEIYEINPCIALYCSVLYAMSGLAVINPTLAAAIFDKMHLNALAEPFITWNAATAQAMSRGTLSRFISAGFTAWQELFVALTALSEAGDAVAGKICRFMSHHAPKAIGGVAAAYGLGYFVTTDLAKNIPGISTIGAAIKEDAGNKPFIEELFAGIKLGTLAYESLQSKPEGQSAVANVISFALKCALFPVRLFITSPINLVFAIGNPARLQNAAKPWKEFYFSVKSVALRGIDATLRLLNLASQVVKRVFKMVVEWLANTLTILTKFIAKLFFVSPKNNAVSAWFIMAKKELFELFGSLARELLKDIYREIRNNIARELRPADKTFTSSSAQVIAKVGIPDMQVKLLAADLPDNSSLAKPAVKDTPVVVCASSNAPPLPTPQAGR